MPRETPHAHHALAAGACAGLAVDVALYPLDTIKTRLQAAEGFVAAGGFRGIYAGLSSVLAGSAPGAALFFLTYEQAKQRIASLLPPTRDWTAHPATHMASAALGEVSACLVRVPTDIIKQNMQAGRYSSLSGALKAVLAANGPAGIYRGYLTTVAREIPFSFIQFPLYEAFKRRFAAWKQRPPTAVEAAVFCGSTAGAIAAALTTPLDVIKTRTMLSAGRGGSATMAEVAANIYRGAGVRGFFRGLGPRVLWISIGGCIFLGMYEYSLGVFRGPRCAGA